jgi:hypothetical protein
LTEGDKVVLSEGPPGSVAPSRQPPRLRL